MTRWIDPTLGVEPDQTSGALASPAALDVTRAPQVATERGKPILMAQDKMMKDDKMKDDKMKDDKMSGDKMAGDKMQNKKGKHKKSKKKSSDKMESEKKG